MVVADVEGRGVGRGCADAGRAEAEGVTFQLPDGVPIRIAVVSDAHFDDTFGGACRQHDLSAQTTVKIIRGRSVGQAGRGERIGQGHFPAERRGDAHAKLRRIAFRHIAGCGDDANHRRHRHLKGQRRGGRIAVGVDDPVGQGGLRAGGWSAA